MSVVCLWSPDGKTLLKSDYGAVWAGVKRLPVPLAQVHALTFSDDGKRLFVAGGMPGERGSVCTLSWPDGRVLLSQALHQDLVVALALTPQGTLVTGSHDGTARCGKHLLEGHTGPVLAVAPLPESNLLVTTCADSAVRVFASDSGTLVRTLSFHTERVAALAIMPHTSRCATGSRDRTVRLWQPGIGRMVRIVRGFEGEVLALAYSPDGTRLYTAGEEGVVRVLDSESDQVVVQWRASAHWVQALALSPDGKTLATGDSAGSVRCWDAASGAPRTLPASGAGGTPPPSAKARRR